MNISYEIILAMLIGILCLSAILLLCSKNTSQKTCLEDAQSANECGANIKLLSRAPVDAEERVSDSNGRMLLEGIKGSEETPRNNLTKASNEQPYEEINLECPSDVTYSTIQEARVAKTSQMQQIQPIESDYSTIETLSKAGLNSSVNPYSIFDERIESPIAPVLPRPREIKSHLKIADDPVLTSSDSSAFAHLYSKVVKQNDVGKNHSLNDLLHRKDKVSRDFHGIDEKKLARNSVIGIVEDLEKVKKTSNCLYSQVNKERKTTSVLESCNLAECLSRQKSKKTASDEGHIYSGIEDDVKVEMIEQDIEESLRYEEINIST